VPVNYKNIVSIVWRDISMMVIFTASYIGVCKSQKHC